MTRKEIIEQLKKFFSIEELVCDHTLSQWGERSWQFLDTEYMHCLLVIRRDILQLPMVCNHGESHQRGLRCNLCQICKDKTDRDQLYLSTHRFGKGGDHTVKGMTAEQARTRIKEQRHLLPCPIRMEKGVNWLHFDVLNQYGTDDKIIEF